ncbi:hypothetical protein VM98_24905 [Streptomyces rubellomurinus subsp. indigoferus]|nr:hypothetical protein VM98_24905 [Streptomyces rubellomurinus subsp. indigoferus]
MPLEVTPERQKRRICCDASDVQLPDENPIDALFERLKNSPRWAPQAIQMNVTGEFVGTDGEEWVTVLVVPTAVHAVYDYDPDHPLSKHQEAEYEFEGWLLGDYREKIWVIGSLLQSGLITLTRLEPGEEIGTEFSGLAWPKNG